MTDWPKKGWLTDYEGSDVVFDEGGAPPEASSIPVLVSPADQAPEPVAWRVVLNSESILGVFKSCHEAEECAASWAEHYRRDHYPANIELEPLYLAPPSESAIRASEQEVVSNDKWLNRFINCIGMGARIVEHQEQIAVKEEIDRLRAENATLRVELNKRAKQIGVACMKHDLTHSLACGRCQEDLRTENAKLRGQTWALEDMNATLRGLVREALDATHMSMGPEWEGRAEKVLGQS